jgi:hypothetical protein
MKHRFSSSSGGLETCRPDSTEEVVEIQLLLSGWQATAVELAAHERGLTTGELVRSLIREFVADRAPFSEVDCN